MTLEELSITIPHHFRCPISLDLMQDPVTLSTGQTYERESIQKWLQEGNATCPATMQSLQDCSLTPNHTLRRLIHHWYSRAMAKSRGRGLDCCMPAPDQHLDPHRLAILLRQASSSSSSSVRLAAFKALRGLAKEEKQLSFFAEAGAVPVLIHALAAETSWEEAEIPEAALAVLTLLLPLDESSMALLCRKHSRHSLSSILRRGSMQARVNAGAMLEALSSSSSSSSYSGIKQLLGGTRGVMEGLVALVRLVIYPAAAKTGIKALLSLCLESSNRAQAVRAGAGAALIELLPNLKQQGDAERALACLELLCKIGSGRDAIASHALAMPALSRMLLTFSGAATECAAGCLLALCRHNEEMQQEAVLAGVFTQLLLLLQTDCTSRAKRKSIQLLKLLCKVWASNPCSLRIGRTDIAPF